MLGMFDHVKQTLLNRDLWAVDSNSNTHQWGKSEPGFALVNFYFQCIFLHRHYTCNCVEDWQVLAPLFS